MSNAEKKEKYFYNNELVHNYVTRLLTESKKALIYFVLKNSSFRKDFKDVEPSDFILEIIEKVLDGRLKLRLDSFEFFRNSIYFHLYNRIKDYFTKDKNKKFYNELLISELNNSNDELRENEYEIRDPENISELLENESLIQEFRKLISNNCSDNEKKFIELLLNGYNKNEIAKNLSLPYNEIYNIERKIIRLLKTEFKDEK